jgi:hypothetical protein
MRSVLPFKGRATFGKRSYTGIRPAALSPGKACKTHQPSPNEKSESIPHELKKA